jgi:hypothetical protein
VDRCTRRCTLKVGQRIEFANSLVLSNRFRPYLPDCELLVTFWIAAERGRGKPHSPPLQAMRWIVPKLVDTGHPVWAEFR